VIAELLDQGHDVAAHQHGAARRGEAVEDGAHDRGRDRVDRLERLVEDQQARAVQQGRGQADLLAHPGGVVTDQGGFGGLEVEHAQQLVDAGGDHRGGHRAQQAEVGEQLAPGELPGQGQAVGQYAEKLLGRSEPRRRPDRVPGDPRIAVVGPQQPDGHGQQRGLARPVRSDQPEERARLDGQVHLADGLVRAEGLAQAADGQRGNPGGRNELGPQGRRARRGHAASPETAARSRDAPAPVALSGTAPPRTRPNCTDWRDSTASRAQSPATRTRLAGRECRW
jgi:hypothetical protein